MNLTIKQTGEVLDLESLLEKYPFEGNDRKEVEGLLVGDSCTVYLALKDGNRLRGGDECPSPTGGYVRVSRANFLVSKRLGGFYRRPFTITREPTENEVYGLPSEFATDVEA